MRRKTVAHLRKVTMREKIKLDDNLEEDEKVI